MPPSVYQVFILAHRRLILYRRDAPALAVQALLTAAAAMVVGTIQGFEPARSHEGTVGALTMSASDFVMAVTCVGVLSAVTHVRTFSGAERSFMRREVFLMPTVSLAAYHVALNLTDLLQVSLLPLVFCVPYYLSVVPWAGFWRLYLTFLGVSWWASGAAYSITLLAQGSRPDLISAFVALVLGAFINGARPSLTEARDNVMAAVALALSYARWAIEILVPANLVECVSSVIVQQQEEQQHQQSASLEADAMAVARLYASLTGGGYCDRSVTSQAQTSTQALLATLSELVSFATSASGPLRSQPAAALQQIRSACQSRQRDAGLVLAGYGLCFRLVAFVIDFMLVARARR